ncbi:RNA polymerase sigma-70 factor [Microbacter margulisiae]|uniref:RNA polymerase sigma-70 factor (ECF subfamily) n=1 Tax=Microbacter margulisiae TaxID=1350067 RepID=A0A7W5H2M7_9PORP|nr:RNA polymerase sigma-70 factor [Microbacter margulisiae]MBB3187611.1 RNA polymerase sigma-70 factor (ECF subfamily) [Microbacter margulisiae]
MLDDLFLIKRIKNDDIEAFEKLFRLYYAPLCRYADSFINDMPSAEELVQDLFYYVWKEREQVSIGISAKAYLYRATRNRAFHYLHHQQITENYRDALLAVASETDPVTPESELEYKELEQQLFEALQRLPERQRRVFCMNRFDGKTYNEIAPELSISVKTVEADMTKVLTILRKELKHFSNHNAYFNPT